MGTVRGKLGEMVLSRTKGQQVSRAYVKQVSNPRTNKQVVQRALFLAAVKFFTRGNQALFKFAFEDRKTNESDYNAFMRNNVKNGIVMSKAQFDNYGYPAVGNYMITKGSLADFDCEIVGPQGSAYTGIAMAEGDVPTTIGALADAFVGSGLYEYGDIITILTINSYTLGEQAPVVIPTDVYNTRWTIKQFILRNDDVRPLSELDLRVVAGSNRRGFALVMDSVGDGDNGIAFAVIHSRNTTSGLKVSTQVLALDDTAQSILEGGRTDAYIDAVVATYQQQSTDVDPQYILQGSLAQGAMSVAEVVAGAVAESQGVIVGNKVPFVETGVQLDNDASTNGIQINFVNGYTPEANGFSLEAVSGPVSLGPIDITGSNVIVELNTEAVTENTDFSVNLMYYGQLLAKISGTIDAA